MPANVPGELGIEKTAIQLKFRRRDALSSRIHHLRNFFILSGVALVALSSGAQTYKVNSNSPEPAQQPAKGKAAQKKQQEKSLGWGSNIQNARLGHAAEEALRNHNYTAAVDYAQRAAQSAPNDAKLWFLLGYCARLAGKTQLSLDAYDHGLRVDPGSLEGLSGLAQTYAVSGRKDEAMALLNRVLAADPRRTSDTLLLGEIMLQSGENEQALVPLRRAEQMKPAARSEVLLALAHQRLKQYDEARRYLDAARRRAPNNPEVLRSVAGFYRETGNYSAAIAALKAIRGGGPQIKAEMAYTYQLAGKPEESVKLYVQAANEAPKDVKMQLSAAQAEVNASAIGAAKPYLKRAAALDPEHYRLHAIQGAIARLEDRDQDAIEEYQAAINRLPQGPPEGVLYPIQLHLNLVELYQHQRDDAAQKRELEIAQNEIGKLDIHGRGRAEFLRLRALVKLQAGDDDGALADAKEALALNDKDPNALQLNGDLLAKMGRSEDAIALYKKELALDPSSRLALMSLGSVSRTTGRDKDAEKYFQRLASLYPKLYQPHLSMGDMYTSQREFAKAEAEYRKAHARAPKNTLIVAGGMNAAIEAHKFDLAANWLQGATPEMRQDGPVLRETERYLMWAGKYQESADAGREAIKKRPQDRDVVVYLGYDLLHLQRYDELLELTSQYESVLPKEPTLPLLAGYVHKSKGELDLARQDFTRSLERDPKVATAYVNRGFVLHDMRRSQEAAADFEAALRLEPKNGEAHLGMAYADLDLHRSKAALQHAKLAEEQMGDSMALHLIRGTAYGNDGMLKKAAAEYRAALTFQPNDGRLHGALGNTLYGLGQYNDAANELLLSDKLSPGRPEIEAQIALCYAQLRDREKTMQYVTIAEKQGTSAAFVVTGQALSLIGDRDAAMQRFERALSEPDADRVAVRLAIARLMLDKDETDDARRQIALALMEAGAGRTQPATGAQLLQTADLFMGMHDYELAQNYFQRALAAGAPETSVRIGLANTYLSLGDTPRAESQLSLISKAMAENEPTYQYLLAQANVARQHHNKTGALTAFAQASEAAGENPRIDQDLMEAGGDEGLRINPTLSLLSTFSVAPIFENTTVYALDAQFAKATPTTLPPPRSSIETQWTGAYHLHLNGLPDAGGFFQVRNAKGIISLPSANAIVNRDTTDYSFNFAMNPALRLGSDVFYFSGGIQETVRRDSRDPIDMNQNLFRQFLYMQTSSFFNWVSVRGFAIRESGPFTDRNEHSRDLAGSLDFRVGRPWGKTALVAGWGAHDEQFSPVNREFYYTSTYLGLERKITENLQVRGIAEYLRSWRVEGNQFAIAQALRPAARVEYQATRNWAVQAQFALSRNMGFHAYDAVESGFTVSYAMPFHRSFEEKGAAVSLRYPIRFSAGMQQESFYNFTGKGNQQFRPFVGITLF